MKKLVIATALACILSLAPASAALAKERVKLDKVIHVCSARDKPAAALACNIYKEARGETVKGQLAVGFVTINRQKSDNFPHTIRGVVYQRKQFSWANSGNNMRVRDLDAWNDARHIAYFLQLIKKYPVVYYFLDFTNGATYYHNTTVNPYWVRDMVKTVSIDHHIFYKEDKDNV